MAVAVATVASVTGASPAWAHANLVSSIPANGTTLQATPTELRLQLSESVERDYTRVELTDGLGRQVPLAGVRLLGALGARTKSPSSVVVPLPPLPPDVYRVSWRTLSSDDLHATDGVFVFGVGRSVAPSATTVPRDRPSRPGEVGLRWLILLSVGTALGAGVLMGLQRGSGGRDAVRSLRLRLLGLSQLGLVLSLLASVALLVVQAGTGRGLTAFGAAWQVLAHTGYTGYGARWAGRAVSAVALLALAVALRRRVGAGLGLPRRRMLLSVVVPATAALGLGTASIGHAGATAASSPGRLLAAAVHGLAATVWTGAVIAAAVALVPRGGTVDRQVRRAVLKSFGAVAALCLLVLVVTGLVLASDGVASLDALAFSLYGRALLVKLGLALLAGLLGLTSTLVLRPALAARVLGRTLPARALRPLVAAEATTMVVLLLAASTLSSSQPAVGDSWRAPLAVSGPVVSGTAADLVESLSITPNRPGRTFLTVSVLDTRRPAPGPVAGVTVTLRGPDGREVSRAAQPAGLSGPVAVGSSFTSSDGWVVAGDDITAPGSWQVRVVARRPGLPDVSGSYGWVVGGAVARHPVRLSATPIAPALHTLAWLFALTGLAVAVVRRRRRATCSWSVEDLPEQEAGEPADGGRPVREVVGA